MKDRLRDHDQSFSGQNECFGSLIWGLVLVVRMQLSKQMEGVISNVTKGTSTFVPSIFFHNKVNLEFGMSFSSLSQ